MAKIYGKLIGFIKEVKEKFFGSKTILSHTDEKIADHNYECEKCGKTIEEGTKYICVTNQCTSCGPMRKSNGLYNAAVTVQIKVHRYHIACGEQ